LFNHGKDNDGFFSTRVDIHIWLNSLVESDDIAWECHKLGRLYANQVKLVEAE
jgi:hypothetical protein